MSPGRRFLVYTTGVEPDHAMLRHLEIDEIVSS
jgi:hypothetical protein